MTPRSLLLSAFPPSKVSDEYDSPTPDVPSDEIPIVDPATIPELHYDPKVHAPGQPWRRGDTDGCHDPIHARWRREGEELIRAAASSVGAVVHDVTWCMAQCIVTLRDTSEVDGGLEGPEVKYDDGSDYDERGTGQPYFWEPTMDDDEYEEMQKTHPNVEYEVLDDWTNDPRGEVDTTVIRTIGKAIIDILQEPAIEDRLEILSRHELMLAKEPTDPNFLITQKQFDKNRGEMVAVETRDPWKSNRTIKGKLVGRNALDVILNVEGSEVTLPQNFIYRVKLE
eukprot:CAMPEP_0172497296 /NCGR_PEP_ID=MMETSP1066-20121228/97767_1 /TAXON_ID=671091 /ORGANISM="Coscinodiscus wailesii, Strain CCMP2513" /LENGTH=281 /DNA_ID=CAMNT_0013269967 /DNA_START=324 /DNA_END=1169 /DNA_ORIENTATION=+